MTVYVPGARLVEVWQLVTGKVAVQSVAPPDVNVTVPDAVPGSPATDSVSCVPYAIDAGAADLVIDVSALLTAKLAPVAAPLL